VLARNVTFLEKSGDLSAIPILSPPSTRKKKSKEEAERKKKEADVSGCSFR
jgi:hypothetical protein